MGAHKRHGCLLPLEMYLEEDIPLVCYIRDKAYAEMVELPEQSCHCFLSFSNASADPPALKVGLLWVCCAQNARPAYACWRCLKNSSKMRVDPPAPNMGSAACAVLHVGSCGQKKPACIPIPMTAALSRVQWGLKQEVGL